MNSFFFCLSKSLLEVLFFLVLIKVRTKIQIAIWVAHLFVESPSDGWFASQVFNDD